MEQSGPMPKGYGRSAFPSRLPFKNDDESVMFRRGFPYWHIDAICELHLNPSGKNELADNVDTEISAEAVNFALLFVEEKIKKLKKGDSRLDKLNGYVKVMTEMLKKSPEYKQFCVEWDENHKNQRQVVAEVSSFPRFHCFQCDLHYTLKNSFARHMNSVHDVHGECWTNWELKEDQMTELKFACPHCDHLFVTEAMQQRHIGRNHGGSKKRRTR